MSSASVLITFTLNCAVFLLLYFQNDFSSFLFEILIFSPQKFTANGDLLSNFMAIFSLLGYGFLHLDFLHFATNSVFLLALGGAYARMTSEIAFCLTYFLTIILCGIAALYMGHALIGSSGGVSGLLGALTVIALFQPQKFRLYAPKINPSSIVSFAIFWLILNILFGLFPSWGHTFSHMLYGLDDGISISWTTHIIGFLIGLSMSLISLLFPSRR